MISIIINGSASYARRLNREIRRNHNTFFPAFESRDKNGFVSVVWRLDVKNVDRYFDLLNRAEKIHAFHAHDEKIENCSFLIEC